MDFKYIKFIDHGEWLEIRLNRPEIFNAIHKELLMELFSAFDRVENHSKCRCVVLSGEGKAFCSGQDLKVLKESYEDIPIKEFIKKYYNPLIIKIRSIKLPVIAKINGPAVGAGCALALATDLVLVCKEAYLAFNFIQIGLVPDAGTSFFLLRRVGYSKAFELTTTGRKVFGEEAEIMGLVDRCVEASELDELVKHYVEHYSSAPEMALKLIKQGLNKSLEMNLDQVLEMEAEHQNKAGSSDEFAEGIRAFNEKRSPNFGKNKRA
ncbi:enoyl-CoA hydratase-related protein [Echinicola jeungdonensis]|uniref:Enoyl-CoA hydratase/isomerase family protein n=1 Tax=Echinicola jeungdonensis TaxID=709343 RepID=A0ABV5J4L1_9BACT|nr:enoyl-CoA hydratase-related protein [Echinicola jeungdonensis]MDN3668174.1 enoyl-CoA hydratase-related protein [Echinicola jeungdonensis]